MPKIIIFDLDGTLTESKQPLTGAMAALIVRLLAVTRVAIISGGTLQQFSKQVIGQLPSDTNFSNLYLLPTSGAALHEWHNGGWNKVYEERISETAAHAIEAAMRAAALETGLINFSERAWGERIEYRGAQVTLSALGQMAPITEKKEWDPDKSKRRALQKILAVHLPQFSVGMGGLSSIDVTRRGIDKAYGIRQLSKRLGIPESEILYIGDQLVAGGNDEAVFNTAARVRAVSSPVDTAQVIMSLLS